MSYTRNNSFFEMKSMKVSAFFRANFFYNRTVLNTFYNSKFYSISRYYKVTFKKWKYIVETLNVDFPFLIIKQKKKLLHWYNLLLCSIKFHYKLIFYILIKLCEYNKHNDGFFFLEISFKKMWQLKIFCVQYDKSFKHTIL